MPPLSRRKPNKTSTFILFHFLFFFFLRFINRCATPGHGKSNNTSYFSSQLSHHIQKIPPQIQLRAQFARDESETVDVAVVETQLRSERSIWSTVWQELIKQLDGFAVGAVLCSWFTFWFAASTALPCAIRHTATCLFAESGENARWLSAPPLHLCRMPPSAMHIVWRALAQWDCFCLRCLCPYLPSPAALSFSSSHWYGAYAVLHKHHARAYRAARVGIRECELRIRKKSKTTENRTSALHAVRTWVSLKHDYCIGDDVGQEQTNAWTHISHLPYWAGGVPTYL